MAYQVGAKGPRSLGAAEAGLPAGQRGQAKLQHIIGITCLASRSPSRSPSQLNFIPSGSDHPPIICTWALPTARACRLAEWQTGPAGLGLPRFMSDMLRTAKLDAPKLLRFLIFLLWLASAHNVSPSPASAIREPTFTPAVPRHLTLGLPDSWA